MMPGQAWGVLTLSCEHLARNKCSRCLYVCMGLEGVFYADSKGWGYGVSQQTLHNTYTFKPNHWKSKNSWGGDLVCVSCQFGFGDLSSVEYELFSQL